MSGIGEKLRVCLSKQKPLTSTEDHVNPEEKNLSFDTSSFKHPINANQLGLDFVKIYLFLGFPSCNNFEVFEGIWNVFLTSRAIVFINFRFELKITKL